MAVHPTQNTDVLRNIMQNVEFRTKRRQENEFQEKLHEIQVSIFSDVRISMEHVVIRNNLLLPP